MDDTDYDFAYTCRFCTRQELNTAACRLNLQSVYKKAPIQNNYNEISIMDLVQSVLPQITVCPTDKLPKVICHSCTQKILHVKKFYDQCEESEQKLKNIVKYGNPKLNGIPINNCYNNDFDNNSVVIKEEELDIDDYAWMDNVVPITSIPIYNNNEAVSSKQNLWSTTFGNQKVSNIPKIESTENILKDNNIATSYTDEEDNDENWINETAYESLPVSIDLKHLSLPRLKSTKHICKTCERCFETMDNLLKHKSTGKCQRYKCEHCPKWFSYRSKLLEHAVCHEKRKALYTCRMCNQTLENRKMLRKHLRTHKDQKKTQNVATSVSPAIEVAAADQRFYCEFCDRDYSLKFNLLKHMKKHFDKKVHLCSICPKRFESDYKLQEHYDEHSPEDDATRAKHLAAREIKMAKLKLKFKKNETTMIPTETNNVVVLPTNILKSKEKKFICNVCNVGFINSSLLARHMRVHTGERPYKCGQCERHFAYRSNLKRHLKRHLGGNVYECKYCPSAFSSTADLRAHNNEKHIKEMANENILNRTHDLNENQLSTNNNNNNDNNNKENLTENTQKRKSNNIEQNAVEDNINHQENMRSAASKRRKTIDVQLREQNVTEIDNATVQTQNEGYKCDHCDKNFINTTELERHIRIHTNERPFPCRFCHLAYKQKAHCMRHLQTHLGEGVNTCSLCPRGFRYVTDLKNHEKEHINEDAETRAKNLAALQKKEEKILSEAKQQKLRRASCSAKF